MRIHRTTQQKHGKHVGQSIDMSLYCWTVAPARGDANTKIEKVNATDAFPALSRELDVEGGRQSGNSTGLAGHIDFRVPSRRLARCAKSGETRPAWWPLEGAGVHILGISGPSDSAQKLAQNRSLLIPLSKTVTNQYESAIVHNRGADRLSCVAGVVPLADCVHDWNSSGEDRSGQDLTMTHAGPVLWQSRHHCSRPPFVAVTSGAHGIETWSTTRCSRVGLYA